MLMRCKITSLQIPLVYTEYPLPSQLTKLLFSLSSSNFMQEPTWSFLGWWYCTGRYHFSMHNTLSNQSRQYQLEAHSNLMIWKHSNTALRYKCTSPPFFPLLTNFPLERALSWGKTTKSKDLSASGQLQVPWRDCELCTFCDRADNAPLATLHWFVTARKGNFWWIQTNVFF